LSGESAPEKQTEQRAAKKEKRRRNGERQYRQDENGSKEKASAGANG